MVQRWTFCFAERIRCQETHVFQCFAGHVRYQETSVCQSFYSRSSTGTGTIKSAGTGAKKAAASTAAPAKWWQ